MAYDYYELLTQARLWAEEALKEGRLSKALADTLLDIDSRSPDTLFLAESSAASARPLIVAFMGGTGVGKSSLLNRLAGQPIAKAGVERPTSREVTLYHHQSLAIRQLPPGLPLESIRIALHQDAEKSNIVWIDMPDFDSIELGNQRLVLEWLPHIDVLLYVVSPERYRDNKAWQLLLAEGAKHAWLFVMNQWDRGQSVQYDDFKQTLHKAGFDNPLVFRTRCDEAYQEAEDDEFGDLLAQLQQLSGRHSVAQLEQRSHELRGQYLKRTLQQLHDEIAGRDYRQLLQYYEGRWQKTESDLRQGLAWPVRQFAQLWAAQPGQNIEFKLWDDWAQNRFDDGIDELILQADQLLLPCKSLKTGLQAVKAKVGKQIGHAAEAAGRQALLNPGNGLQKFLLKLTSISETLLPIVAMAVVGYQVFSGYYHGATQTGAYLGTDFAIHSVLLIALSWLIPFFLHKKIQPSLQNAAQKGLQKGLQQALSAIAAEIEAVLREEEIGNQEQLRTLNGLIEKCEPARSGRFEADSLLGRVLLAN